MGFEIILVNDKDAPEKIRKHLNIVQSNQRRQKHIEKRQARASSGLQSIVSHGPLAWRHRDGMDDNAGIETERLGCLTKVEAFGSRAASGSGPTQLLPHPLTVLGATPKDPFASYPVRWDSEIDVMIDFTMHCFGPRLFDYTRNQHHDIFRPQLKLALSDPASFHVIMLLASDLKDRFAGHSLPGLRALYHRVEAIRLVNERFALFDSDAPGDGGRPEYDSCLSETSIFAVMVLCAMEKQFHIIGDHEVQATGLQQLLVLSGGIEVLHTRSPVLESALYGLALMVPMLLNPASPDMYRPTQPHLHGRLAHSALAAELFEFLSKVSLAENAEPLAKVNFAFTPGSGIHQLVESPSQFWGPYRDNITIVRDRLRAGIVFYALCMVTGIDSPEDSLEFNKHLKWVLQQEWIWKTSLRMLQWLLVNKAKGEGLAHTGAAWKALRLVSATSLLNHDIQETVQGHLLGLLSGVRGVYLNLEIVKDKVQEFRELADNFY